MYMKSYCQFHCHMLDNCKNSIVILDSNKLYMLTCSAGCALSDVNLPDVLCQMLTCRICSGLGSGYVM